MCEAAPPLPGLAEGKGIRNLLIWVTEASFWSSKSRSPPWLGSTHQLLPAAPALAGEFPAGKELWDVQLPSWRSQNWG